MAGRDNCEMYLTELDKRSAAFALTAFCILCLNLMPDCGLVGSRPVRYPVERESLTDSVTPNKSS
jgi:hypothetical protein